METLGMMQQFNNIYAGKTVLVTGHAGFKGTWLSLWLTQLGAKVVGYSLIPEGDFSLYQVLEMENKLAASEIADVRDRERLQAFFTKWQPDMVFHLAAQPLVRLSYAEPVMTYETNVMGSLNTLEAARQTPSVKVFVNVTTDKCYENKERAEGYREDEPMGGHDMYSSSKGCVELLTASFRNSFLKDGQSYSLGSARAGNVIGGGDWAADRLIPDCARSLSKGGTIFIRNPLATRPWQHVLEPLAGYLLLGQKLWEGGARYAQGYNFGPDLDLDVRVAEVAQEVATVWGEGKVEVGSSDGLHEATLLQLNIDKAKTELGFKPVWSAKEAIQRSAQWYQAFYQGDSDMHHFTLSQMEDFFQAASNNNTPWSLS